MRCHYRTLAALSVVAVLGLLLNSSPARAQYTSGIAMDARGPYTNTYIAPWYAPAYAPVVPPLNGRYTPILMTSINYPGVYGSYSMSIAALDYRGPILFADRYAPPVQLETAVLRSQVAVGSPALIDVRLPADAELRFQGVRVSRLGTFRRYATPPLSTERTYGYDVQASWMENGRLVTQERHVRVSGGDRVVIDFTEPPTIERGTPEGGTSELRSVPLPK